ncbi:disulfide bond formation protein DsbB [Holospora undulata HU1]|uniref:Disulfide bond formation protein DsbB n=1 Tax=Holospora undulata HU1 TaxID=1321371 RepID=A0A061JGV9_9PROT|nr:disulfide bond formation protein DsbB [Holospora undulata HU1]
MLDVRTSQLYSWNTLIRALGGIAFMMAIFAYILDYFFGYTGCTLCHVERTLLMITGTWTVYASSSWIAFGLWCLGGGVTFYHLSVQNHWLPLASFCKAPVPSGDTLNAQMENFLSKPGVSCDEITLKVLGISAVYFLFTFFTTGCLIILWKILKTSKKYYSLKRFTK